MSHLFKTLGRSSGQPVAMELSVLEDSYRAGRSLIAAVTADDLGRPTPCSEWDLAALLNHYLNAISMFPVMLDGGQPDWQRQLDLDDRVALFDAAVNKNLRAWKLPGAVDAPVPVLPGMRLIDLNLIDAVVHAWDLATALSLPIDIEVDAVTFVFEKWRAAPLHLSRQFGAFGPEVPVPDNAPDLARLLGLTGRDPALPESY